MLAHPQEYSQAAAAAQGVANPWGFPLPIILARPSTPMTSVAQASVCMSCPIPPHQIIYFYNKMNVPKYLAAPILLALAIPQFTPAQSRTVAITVDDLPYAGRILNLPNYSADEINNRLLAAFAKHRIPVTGFVIERSVDETLDRATGTRVLQHWITNGLDLGNHSYSHPDFNNLSIDQIKEEITKGEATFATLMKSAGKQPEFFRFPMNHAGDTNEKHDAIAAFITERGYHLATCTIDNSDYLFNVAYVKMLQTNDTASAQRLRAEYLAYTSTEIDYYASLNKQVFTYEPPQVMLLHDNPLNADTIQDVLKLFEEKGYKFVSLKTAQSDPAYKTPETCITKFGWMWGYRWAQELKVKVNGNLETEPPKWILDYGKETSGQLK
jgi:peptidoglycan-N-acetylglucosamine deacetylase